MTSEETPVASEPRTGRATPGPTASSTGATVVESDDGVHYTYHDLEEDGLATTVTLALAEVADADPLELVPEFSRHADPDALDRLFRSVGDDADARLDLTVEGYDVSVYDTGRIELEETHE